MRDRLRVQTHAADLGHGTGVIGGVDRVGQEELGLAFGGIDFNRQDQGRPDQNPTRAGLGDNERSFFNAIADGLKRDARARFPASRLSRPATRGSRRRAQNRKAIFIDGFGLWWIPFRRWSDESIVLTEFIHAQITPPRFPF